MQSCARGVPSRDGCPRLGVATLRRGGLESETEATSLRPCIFMVFPEQIVSDDQSFAVHSQPYRHNDVYCCRHYSRFCASEGNGIIPLRTRFERSRGVLELRCFISLHRTAVCNVTEAAVVFSCEERRVML